MARSTGPKLLGHQAPSGSTRPFCFFPFLLLLLLVPLLLLLPGVWVC
jgi:hypothetical protein